MASGWLTPHCSACMPPIDGPITATTWSMPNFSFEQAILRFHHVAHGEFRKTHARLGLGIARRGRKAIADRIGANDEVFVGIERLAGADHEIEAVMVAAQRRHHQNGVGFLVVELAVGDVGDREILDRLAAFELEVAFAIELVRRLLRRMGQSGQRQQRAQTKGQGNGKANGKANGIAMRFTPVSPHHDRKRL